MPSRHQAPETPGRQRSDGSAHLSAGTRRHITILFTDVVGFTEISERLGEEAVFEIIRRIAGEQASAIEAHGGVLQDFAGDGIMAVFGAPVALEDACLRACRTAVDIQARMRQLEPELQRIYGVRLQLRIGIHTGAAVVGQIGLDKALAYNALGDSVNVAARIQSAADPGAIFLSKASLDLLHGFVDATAVGERAFKGKAEKLPLYRLDKLHSGLTRFGAKLRQGLVPLQERHDELALLHDRWGDLKSGVGTVVNVVGEAGIGKSRLLFEFEDTLQSDDAILLEAVCRPETLGTPFFPLLELIRRWLALSEKAPRAQVAAKLEDALTRLGLDCDTVRSYMLDLLAGPDPDASLAALPASELVGVRTREALTDLILAWGRLGPSTVLVAEDLHWVDTGSEDVLQSVIERVREEPLLILCSFRPEYRPPWGAARA